MPNLKQTERPIIFSGPMVRALLEGRKTQTRRLLSPQPTLGSGTREDGAEGVWWFWRNLCWKQREMWNPAARCPHGAIGGRLWVREALYLGSGDWRYCADGELVSLPYNHPQAGAMISWAHHNERDSCSPVFMPRWASRLELEIVSVRAEQLQRITREDAEAEGVERLFTQAECDETVGLAGTRAEAHGWRNYLWHGLVGRTIRQAQADAWPHQFSSYKHPRGSFSSAWESINGKRAPWAENPWVWRIEFRRLTPAISPRPEPE